MIRSFFRVLYVIHIVCRFRLFSVLPPHPAVRVLIALQYLMPSAWYGLVTEQHDDGERLRRALEALGPIFIKFGQLMATRRDLLNPQWIDALAQLQDRVAPFPAEQARQRIEYFLGIRIDDVFAKFDETPLASASIAQVHSARLKNQREVVIKVARPGLQRIVDSDLRVMKSGARWLERVWPDARYIRPLHVVEEYEHIIRNELDLALEARNSEKMRRQFLFSPLLFIPEMHMDLVCSHVIVMDRIRGIPVNDVARIEAAGINPKVLAERGVEIFFMQVFRYNFFHADMHPGNIFVSPDHPQSPQYMAIDAAIVGTLSQADLQLLARLALMVLRQNYTGMVELVIRAGWTTAPVDRHRMERDLQDLLEPVFSMPLNQLEFAPLVLKLFDLARSHHVEAPIQYILLLKTLIHVEGLGRQLYPELDIWTLGRPMLEQWMMEHFGPSATMKKLRDRTPEWAAQLPDIPDLLRDALENLRDLPKNQRKQEAHLTHSLLMHRRKLFAGTLALGWLVLPWWHPALVHLASPATTLLWVTPALFTLFWALKK